MEQDRRVGQTYTRGAIAFHWVIAALIVLNFVLVWSAEGAPRPEQQQIMANHKAVGLTVLILSVLRILWRIVHPPVPLAESLKPWEAALAKVVHASFYFLIVAIPFTGWAMVSAGSGGMPVSYFGLFDIPGLPFTADRQKSGVFHEVHELLAILALALLALHVAGALKHDFLDRDGNLGRMIPWLR